jgi:hypothetical protein
LLSTSFSRSSTLKLLRRRMHPGFTSGCNHKTAREQHKAVSQPKHDCRVKQAEASEQKHPGFTSGCKERRAAQGSYFTRLLSTQDAPGLHLSCTAEWQAGIAQGSQAVRQACRHRH